jgi:class 3 adenylate cyclase
VRRLGLVDWILIGTLVPAWVAALSLQLHAVRVNGYAVLPFTVSSAPADDFPRIDHVWRGVGIDHLIRPGDRLVRIGSDSLRGATSTGFEARAYRLSRNESQIRLALERDRRRFDVPVQLHVYPFGWWTTLPFALSLGIIAVLLLVRAPRWALRRRFFAAAMVLASYAGPFHMLGGAATWVWMLGVQCLAVPLAIFATLWITFEWTEASRPARGWQLALSGVVAAAVSGTQLWKNLLPAPRGFSLIDVSDVTLSLFFVSFLVATLWTARSATPLERRQGRWILLGFFFGLVPLVAAMGASLADFPLPSQLLLGLAARIILAAIPLGLFVSVIGYGWLDIDRLIGASATYTLLGTTLLGGAFFAVPRVSEGVGSMLGFEPETSRLLLSMLLAAVAVPAYRVVRPWVDRLLVAERFEVDRGFDALLRELPGARDARELAERAGEAVYALLRPESAAAYARSGDAFEPLFVRGTAVPPALPSESSLVRAFGDRSRPLVGRRFAERGLREKLSPFDQAALDTLGSAVVLPVRLRDELVAFLSLGPKRSGDIYAPGDLTLLRAVADAVSTRLERFEDEEVAREAQAMQEELRRFVPGAVARVIESAESLEPREQAVSVLFVDIRGYATYAETRAAHEIFSTVNRYTRTVSGLVEEHGGAVVEFNGDGMMAVFGAPNPLPEKEGAAVASARAIMAALSGNGAEEEPALSVGVGIATGTAYVGAVQASDRLIWTALGNTTNLAARLQALTRELEAAVVIDAATERSAGELARGFVRRPQVAIRGRAQREDVYLLPLAATTAG